MAQTNGGAQEQLKRLGAGGSGDRLNFSLVLDVMWRFLPLLSAVWGHLVGIVFASAAIAGALLIASLQVLDVFWTRVLKGDAPTAMQVSLLRALHVTANPWTHAARKEALRGLVGVSVVLILIGAISFMAMVYYRVWILQRINQVLRLRLLDRMQSLSLRFHNDSAVGDTIYRMHQDSAMVTQLIDVAVLLPLLHFGRLLLSVPIVLAYDPWLALMFCAGWPISLYIGYRFSRPMRIAFRGAREQNSALTSLIQASLQGIRVIKAYGAERVEQQRFEQASKAAFAQAYIARSLNIVYRTLIFWVFAGIVVLATGWAALLTTRGAPLYATTVVALMGFSVWNVGVWNAFKARIGDGMLASTQLFELWGTMQDVAIGLDRVLEMLDLEPEVKDAPDAIDMPAFTREIVLENVCFSYDGARTTLDGVNLRAEPGTITAIVGPTGSGKSTLMSLLLRLYEPDTGSIRIDGVDLRKLKLHSLRDNIAIALQENMLFGTTIRDNIRYARPAANDSAVREAARVAAADDFIEKLPEGYDTLLGERGQKLSTGQRQRLSIARALLKDTPILILDEPTAALDAQTELRVLDNLAVWGKGRAVFLITHRLSTIRRADHVAFLKEGQLIEYGSHDTLMARPSGAYRSLVEGEEAAARAVPQAVSP